MPSDGKNSESPTIEHVFELLDKWRHLPAYKLEPRADIFFALYLPEVLEEEYGIKINQPLIPEFPIGKNKDDNRHKQVGLETANFERIKAWRKMLFQPFSENEIAELEALSNQVDVLALYVKQLARDRSATEDALPLWGQPDGWPYRHLNFFPTLLRRCRSTR